MMVKSAGVFAPLAAICCLAMLAGCSVPANEGQESWNRISLLSDASPQAAENRGEVSGVCRGAGAPRYRNASVTQDRKDYRIERGDKLHLAFYQNSEFDRDVQVRPDGKFTAPPVGDVSAVGLTPAQLARKLDSLYSEDLWAPGATVQVLDSPSRAVFVGGQVNYPGMVALKPGMTATQAIAATGWLREDARTDQIVLIRRDACGEPYGTFIQIANAIDQDSAHQQDIALMPGDIIVVPRSTIGKMDLFIKQYIRDLLPVQPYLSIGVGSPL